MKVKFGSIRLSSVPFVETLQKFLDFAFRSIENYRSEVLDAKNKKEYFESERVTLISKLEEYRQKKDDLENILYSKFLSVLNAKKDRIAALEQEISDLLGKTTCRMSDTANQECERADVAEDGWRGTQASTKEIANDSVSKRSIGGMKNLSENETDKRETCTAPSMRKRKINHKENVKTKSNVLVKNIPPFEKNEGVQHAEKSFLRPNLKSDILDLSNPTSSSSYKASGIKPEILYTSSTFAAVPSLSLENSHSKQNDSGEHSEISKHSKCVLVNSQQYVRGTLSTKKAEITHALNQTTDNTLPKNAEIICPIDLVSGKIRAPSNISTKEANNINNSENTKKTLSSSAKHHKDFDIISPLDMLTPAACFQNNKISTDIQKKSNVEGAAPSKSSHDNSCFGFPTNSAFAVDAERSADYYFENQVEPNHYDSETDVDEPEDSCTLSNNFGHPSFNVEQSKPVASSSTVKNSLEAEYGNLHQEEQGHNVSENSLNESQDTDTSSLELPTPALPKRVRRSDRINKCVPIDSKSINHFTKLGPLQVKSQNALCDEQIALYEQETQLVDTQKLLDQM